MNMQNLGVAPVKPETQPVSETTRLPYLARLSGRDVQVLRLCPGDVIAESCSLGTSLLVASALHAISMSAALTILNVPLPMAIGIALVTATGLFHADRVSIRASDIAMAEASILKIDATGTPRLGGWASRAAGKLLRIVFSTTTALSLAAAVAMWMFSADATAVTQRRQLVLDAPLLTQAMIQLGSERAALDLEKIHADKEVAAVGNADSAVAASQVAMIAERSADFEQARQQVDTLRLNADAAHREAAVQRNIARCELAGIAPGCEQASGSAGRGRLYILADARATDVEALAAALDADLQAAEAELELSATSLAESRNGVLQVIPTNSREAEQRALLAVQAIATFEASVTGRAAIMVEQNPRHRVLDPNSLAERLSAIAELSRDPAFLAAVIAIKLVALAIELLALITAAMTRPTEYALLRGQKLAYLARRLHMDHVENHLDDLGLKARYRRDRRDAADQDIADELVAQAARSGMASSRLS